MWRTRRHTQKTAKAVRLLPLPVPDQAHNVAANVRFWRKAVVGGASQPACFPATSTIKAEMENILALKGIWPNMFGIASKMLG